MIEIDVSQPIYQQIIDGLSQRVVRGVLAPGDQIPSQREMAEILKVSPNTVQRAYRDLEAMGVVETARGQGTFVASGPELIAALRQRMLDGAVKRFLQEMVGLGYRPADAPELVAGVVADDGPTADAPATATQPIPPTPSTAPTASTTAPKDDEHDRPRGDAGDRR